MALVPVPLSAIGTLQAPPAAGSDRFARAPGVLVEALGGDEWVAFSALSGETHLINETSAAIIDLLDEKTPASTEHIVDCVASETGLPHDEVTALLSDVWDRLLQGGLIRRVDATEPRLWAP